MLTVFNFRRKICSRTGTDINKGRRYFLKSEYEDKENMGFSRGTESRNTSRLKEPEKKVKVFNQRSRQTPVVKQAGVSLGDIFTHKPGQHAGARSGPLTVRQQSAAASALCRSS